MTDRETIIKQATEADQALKLLALEAENHELRKTLDFYARHHHHLNTTAPNYAWEALKSRTFIHSRPACNSGAPLDEKEGAV